MNRVVKKKRRRLGSGLQTASTHIVGRKIIEQITQRAEREHIGGRAALGGRTVGSASASASKAPSHDDEATFRRNQLRPVHKQPKLVAPSFSRDKTRNESIQSCRAFGDMLHIRHSR